MGAKENARKRAAIKADAATRRDATNLRLANLREIQTEQTRNLRVKGGWDVRIDPRDLREDRLTYVCSQGHDVGNVQPHDANMETRFLAGRPKHEHSRMIPKGGISTRL